MKTESERIWKEAALASSMYYPGIIFEKPQNISVSIALVQTNGGEVIRIKRKPGLVS
jgi:hypothetical protein